VTAPRLHCESQALPVQISIVVPCCNDAATLAAAIRSALSQAALTLEIAVVDDGSTDDSLIVARSFEPRVRVITGPNRGVSSARNRGIAETRGEWIVFLDADDMLLPGTLAERLTAAEMAGADVVVCNWQELVDDGQNPVDGAIKSIDSSTLIADAELACATTLWATTAALMYRRSLVEKIGGFHDDLPVIQDARFLFDAAYHRARFVHSAHVGARYRVRPDSLSRRDPARFWRDVLVNGKQIEALWRARGPLSATRCEALCSIFDTAARGLFRTAHPDYFEAVERQRRLTQRLPIHPRVAAPLARALGLRPARRLLRLTGR
jgi:glycosyltransferase involved in cell wall biosynthesis